MGKLATRTTSVQIGLAFAEIFLAGIISYYGFKWLSSALDPTSSQKKEAKKQAKVLLKAIGVDHVDELTEYELLIATHVVDTTNLTLSWNHIGGLDSVVEEITESVIIPMKGISANLPQSSLLCPPKGVLLYGPPGCGKTMVAKATAKEAGCRFVNLDISTLTDKWYGESQKLAAAVFSLARKIQPCIIFIDEIDSFLRLRAAQDHEATAMMKAQFMSLWDGLTTEENCNVIILGATNRPYDVDKAILRRMPCRFKIDLPGQLQRSEILRIILSQEQSSEDIDYDLLAKRTETYSGSDLKELCRLTAIESAKRLRDSSKNESRQIGYQITQTDFDHALARMKLNDIDPFVVNQPSFVT